MILKDAASPEWRSQVTVSPSGSPEKSGVKTVPVAFSVKEYSVLPFGLGNVKDPASFTLVTFTVMFCVVDAVPSLTVTVAVKELVPS